jgi:pimeloyl-ACP methyl ester carboxylesterase
MREKGQQSLTQQTLEALVRQAGLDVVEGKLLTGNAMNAAFVRATKPSESAPPRTEQHRPQQARLTYLKSGRGPRPLVVFQGSNFTNSPSRMYAMMYRFLGKDYTLYSLARRHGMPAGYSLTDMANDYAAFVAEAFSGPVDVIGVSTGGSLALVFAADHPELVRRLVVHSAAHQLSEPTRKLQLGLSELVSAGDWRAAYAKMFSFGLPSSGPLATPAKLGMRALAGLASIRPPKNDAADFVALVAAEDQLAFSDRLPEITAETLVIAGTKDPYYTPMLFRETADGIPNAQLILYEGKGHAPMHAQFRRDVSAFLLRR